MLQTRTILILTVTGLLLPLLIILLRQSSAWFGLDPMDCRPVTAYLESVDNITRLPNEPVLVLGDTAARNWPDDIAQLGTRPALVRAIDGLTVEIVGNCFTRLVGHYRPSTVVLLLGDRDLDMLETELSEHVRAVSQQIDALNTDMTLIVSGLLRAPARDNNRVDRLNLAVAAEATRRPGLAYLEPNPAFASPSGAPDPQRFWPNGKTLGASSYPALAQLIEAKITGNTPTVDRL